MPRLYNASNVGHLPSHIHSRKLYSATWEIQIPLSELAWFNFTIE